MEEGGQGGQPSDQNSSFEVDLDLEKSSNLDVEAEKEKAKSRWDEPEDVGHSRELDGASDRSKDRLSPASSPRGGTPTIPSSPRSCPPTPEALPPGLRTPPPSTSSGQVRKRKSRSLDGRPVSPEESTCPICLGEVENRSMTNSCLHKFCFTCLQEWSKVKAECPLCKGKFSSILYNIRSDSEYDSYPLPPPSPRAEGGLQEYLYTTRRFHYHTTMTTGRAERRRQFLDAQVARMGEGAGLVLPAQPFRELSSRQIWRRRRGPGTSDFRRDVYATDLWAQPLHDASGRNRECSPEWYRTNEAQTHRLVPWLNRELLVLLEMSGQQSLQAHLIQLIIDWVKVHPIQSPEMRDLLLPYLSIRTEHFQHELFNFARTPFDLTGYDRNVTYTTRAAPHTEVVSSGSESEVDPDGAADTSVQVIGQRTSSSEFIDQVRNRLEETRRLMHESMGRFNGMLEERLASDPSLSRGGVTNYPDRAGTRQTHSGDHSTNRDIEDRARDDDRRSTSRSRSKDRDYRREMDRFWDIRSRISDGDREGQRRRKGRKPTKVSAGSSSDFSRWEQAEAAVEHDVEVELERQLSPVSGALASFRTRPEAENSSSEADLVGSEADVYQEAIDLSTGGAKVGSDEFGASQHQDLQGRDKEHLRRMRMERVAGEDQPSTSRGGGSGLLRLVIPDSDSEAEVASPGSPRLEIDVTGTEPALSSKEGDQETAQKEKEDNNDSKEAQEWGVVVEEVSTSQEDWMRMISAPATSSHPGYYTTSSYPSVSDVSGLNFLSDVVSLQRALQTPPLEDASHSSLHGKKSKKAEEKQRQEEEEDNSDLEVVDVVRAKPRKPREVTVVELSSSEDEAAADLSLRHQLDLSGFIPLQGSGRASKPQDSPSFDPNEPIMILSSDEEEELLQTVTPNSYAAPPAMRMQLNTLMQRKPVQEEESSSEDDLIVVKTEHCTIDPITKKQITEPVRNKKCNHIYEKATIYSMIDQAREHQKPVRCPYMGCNQKDFKKTDLVKDREVAKHLEEKRDEKERDDLEKAKEEEAKREARKKKREEEGEQSADSIVEEVISMMRTNRGEEEEAEQEENESSRLEESSGSSQPPSTSNSSTKSSSGEVPGGQNDPGDEHGAKAGTIEPEPSKGKVSRKPSKPAHQMSDSSDSDIPLSKARQKRKKKTPKALNDSFSGSEFDEENSESEQEATVRVKKAKKVIKKKPPKKKVKIMTSKDTTTNVKIKKVTETWSISEQKAGGSKRKDRKRAREPDLSEDSEDDDDAGRIVQEQPASRKGKSSSKRPPKNKPPASSGSVIREQPMEVQVPKRYSERAKKVFYAEFEDDF